MSFELPSERLSGSTGGPPPLNRSQIAAYASFLDDLQTTTSQDLSQRLLYRFSPDRYADDGLVLSDGSETERERSKAGYTRVSKSLGKRKRRRADGDAFGTRWPVTCAEIDKPSSLEETVISFAQSYIRQQGLDILNLEENENDLADPVLPCNLVPSTVEMINELLAKLAMVRLPGTSKKRKQMPPLDWEGVMGVAGMIPRLRWEVMSTNGRLQSIYPSSVANVLEHRLQILDTIKTMRTATVPLHKSLYAPVLSEPNPLLRPHLSKTEISRRAEKRRLREQARLRKKQTAHERNVKDPIRQQEEQETRGMTETAHTRKGSARKRYRQNKTYQDEDQMLEGERELDVDDSEDTESDAESE
ncbi:hypothetical protein L204_101808 [Cryptococcus depauperatus]|nr:hypothetical protein L204_04220 [Cryptococcus depauperatus CBS 7855]